MKKTIITILATIATLLVLLMSWTVYITTKEIDQKEKDYTVEISTTDYKKAFMLGCVERESLRPYCECFHTELMKRYSQSELKTIYLDYLDTKKMPESFFEIANKCANK